MLMEVAVPTSEWVEPGVATLEPEIRACPNCGDLYEGSDHTCSPPKSMEEADQRLEGSVRTSVLAQMAMAPLPVPGHLGTKEEIQEELDGIARSIRTFHLKQPDQVMRESGAYSARLTELRVLLHRVESTDRQYTRVRTQQVERWLDEIDRQFKIASRLLEASRQDLELMR
jgi:hypothetical protein